MIVVCGESLIDLLIDSRGGITLRAGGGPYNAARTVSRLGQSCVFLGRFASDRFGGLLKTTLIEDGVQLACPEPLEAPTTLAMAEISDRGDASYHFYLTGTAASLVDEADVRRALNVLTAAPIGCRAVHVGTLGLVMEPIATSLELLVRELPEDAILMLDPNCRPAATRDPEAYRERLARLLTRTDVVKVSEDDLAFMMPGESADDAARSLLSHGPMVILLTRGSKPATAITAAGRIEIPVPQVRVADTVGAGDSLGGAFVAWWMQRGLSRLQVADMGLLHDGLAFATAVATMTCQRVGADPPRLADLDASARSSWSAA